MEIFFANLPAKNITGKNCIPSCYCLGTTRTVESTSQAEANYAFSLREQRFRSLLSPGPTGGEEEGGTETRRVCVYLVPIQGCAQIGWLLYYSQLATTEMLKINHIVFSSKTLPQAFSTHLTLSFIMF